MTQLSGSQLRFLRSLGQHLKPTISVGKGGYTPNVRRSIENGFNTRELLKIRVQDGCESEPKELAEVITQETDSSLVQLIGHVILVYKPHYEKPVIILPA